MNNPIMVTGRITVLLTGLLLNALITFAQVANLGLPYQAVARDAAGDLLTEQALTVQISLTGKDRKAIYFAETHSVTTDATGYFSLEIGSGRPTLGDWLEVPWYLGQLWLESKITSETGLTAPLVNRIELQAVPYAFAANTTERLAAAPNLDERTNFNIFWSAEGNYKTVPNVHFIGTRDDQDLYLKTNNKTRLVFSKSGQMTLFADGNKGTNDADEIAAYQLYVRSKEQGVFIELAGNTDSGNNFMTFADQTRIRGAVEGQTAVEVITSGDFILTNLSFAIDYVLSGAVASAEAIQAAGYAVAALLAKKTIFLAWKAPGYWGAFSGATALAAIATASTVSIGAQALGYNINALTGLGVAYSSGGADYAEYLPKAIPEAPLFPGDIVGVKSGKISWCTQDADHLMVISRAPAILGNLPSPEKIDRFEQVAFLGQVPVKVRGPVQAGDYILPSGLHDGTGIAVAPEHLPTASFGQILGVAWETRKVAPHTLHQVNMSVGLQKNSLAPRVDRLEKQVDNILAYLEGKAAFQDFSDSTSTSRVVSETTQSSMLTENSLADHLDEIIEQQAPAIHEYYDKLENLLQQQDIYLRDYPVWERILDDPVAFVKAAHKNPTEALKKWQQHPESSNN